MGRNDHRVAAIREATFGREVREPICRSIEKTQSTTSATLSQLVDTFGYRIQEASTTPVPEREGYFTLTLTRANGS